MIKKELKENNKLINNNVTNLEIERKLISEQIKNNSEIKGYSRTKAVKFYVEKVNKIIKEVEIREI